MKMTKRKLYILQQLCECEPNTGIVLSAENKHTGDKLINEGLAYSITAGSVEIFIATEEGRQALSE